MDARIRQKEATMEDALFLNELVKEQLKDRLREAERSHRLLRAKSLRELPTVLRTILMIFA